MKNESKLCIRFWSALSGSGKYESIVVLVVAILFPRNIIMLLLALALFAYRSLTLFPSQNYQLLVLSVPFSRKTIWRTHFAMETVLFSALLVGFLLRNRYSLSEILAISMSVLFAHLTCAIIPRRPLLWMVSALPGFGIQMLAFVALQDRANAPMRSISCDTIGFLLLLVLLNVLLAMLDIIAWRKEGKRFLKGGAYV